ncbi:MAG: NrfD/PsrC family molybdoenzyme membrane anchor subunit [Pseudomonadota bacterium]
MPKLTKQLTEFFIGLAFFSSRRSNPRIRTVKAVLWFFAGLATTVGVVRYIRGLGTTTALTDTTPWGLWIGFDVFSGVALAAGGFVIAATVYIFHLKRYKPILRAAVLTAFLGYIAVAVGLLFDLGIPWNIIRPALHWQHHSALFEVAWCVMLYLTVLALEFAPVIFEKMPFPRLFKFFKAITLPMVILGIMLSTLHQSSLGSLILIMPFRVHPLWYTPMLPLFFFVSAIGLGLAMVSMESLVTTWLYRRKPELNLVRGLARAASIVLGLYVVLVLGDLALHGKLHYLAEPTWETSLFIFELSISAIIPAILFTIPGVRKSRAGLTIGSGMVVLGFVLNRIDVSGITTISVTGSNYFPAWTEFAISIGIVSAAALVFFFFVERFNVYDPDEEEEESPKRLAIPGQDNVSGVRLAAPWASDGSIYSLVYITAAALAFLFMPDGTVENAQPRLLPVEPVKTVAARKVKQESRAFHALKLEKTDAFLLSESGDVSDVLLMDADRNGKFVLFDHGGHRDKQGGDLSCGKCHHMNKPFDRATSCGQCHGDMFSDHDIFDHDMHAAKMGGNEACVKCHADPDQTKSMETAKPCLSCHKNMLVEDSLVSHKGPGMSNKAPGYMKAMHGLCVECHARTLEEKPGLGEDFARCGACHVESDPEALQHLYPYPVSDEDQVTKHDD